MEGAPCHVKVRSEGTGKIDGQGKGFDLSEEIEWAFRLLERHEC
jgi:hypothetical protein